MTVFPFSLETPVRFDGPAPEACDVVVIGGGVIGVCTALFLAEAGQKVVLLEKGRIAAEQSSRNWGWVRQQGRDKHELPIMAEANAIWRDLAARAPVDLGLRQTGVVYLADSVGEMAGYEGWLPDAKAAGVDSRLLSAREAADLIPDMSRRYEGALYTPSDMRAEPWVAVPAIAQIAQEAGAVLVENYAVRALDIEGGVVAGVITEQGRIKAPRVVLAGGAWSSLFLQNAGVALPQLSVRSTVAATAPMSAPFQGGAADTRIAFRARADGGVTLAAGGAHDLYLGPQAFRAAPKFFKQLAQDPFGTKFLPAAPKGYPDAWGTARRWSGDEASPFEAMRILNPAPNRKSLGRIKAEFEALFPTLGPIELRASWAGMIDTMPDVVPVMDHVAALPGLILGTGFSGHGFGIGPGAGKVLAMLAMGEKSPHDLHRFRLARFRDGSSLELGPSI